MKKLLTRLSSLLLLLTVVISAVSLSGHVFAQTETNGITYTEPVTEKEITTENAQIVDPLTAEEETELNAQYDEAVSEVISEPDEEVFSIAAIDENGNEIPDSEDIPNEEESIEQAPVETPDVETSADKIESASTEEPVQEAVSEETATPDQAGDSVTPSESEDSAEQQTLREYCNETQKKLVAVIDTGVSHEYAAQRINFTDENGDDTNGHGTIMAKRIIEYSEDKGVILSLKAFTSDGRGTIGNVTKALQYAIDLHVDIINMSFSAVKDEENADKTAFESLARSALEAGIQIVAAAGNDNSDVANYIPASIDNVISVGAMDADKVKQAFSNYGNVSYYQYAGSTSEAAAILAGKLAGEKDLSNEVTSKTIILNSISRPNDNNTNDPYFKLSSTLVLEGIATYSGAGSWNGYTYTPNSSFVAYAPVPSGYSNSVYSCGGVDISSSGTDIRGRTFQTRESSSSGSVTRHAACSFKSGTKSTTNPNQNNYDAGLPGNGASGYITYVAHVANVGWQNWVSDGRTAGTTGQSHAIEAMALASNHVGLQYRAYASSYGWLDWKTNGHVTGSTGQSLSLQAMQINLTGADASGYTLQYRAHIASVGWLGWVNAGGVAGQAGSGRQMEAIEIKLTPKSFNLDLNGLLDGGTQSGLGNFATADVYINGKKVATGVNDFYKSYTYGSTYKVVVTPTAGHSCNKMTFTGTIKGNTEVKPTLTTNSYALSITGDSGVESITGNGSYKYGSSASVTYKIKPGYHITSLSGTTADGGTTTWTDKAGMEGTITDSWGIGTCDRTIKLTTAPNVYSNNIAHWAWGFQNKEGNNGSDKTAFQLNSTSFSKSFGEKLTYTASDAVTPPNGFALRNTFGSSAYGSGWKIYSLGTSFTQPAAVTNAEYDYDPITYNLTYNLDGGALAKANPSTYNVLYGVSFANNPTY